ncbi:MAG: hypothetical protein AB8H79_02240, partial [Myxococcota bacterium]
CAPNPGAGPAPIPEPEPQRAALPSPDSPFADCKAVDLEQTRSWACGDQAIVRVRHTDALPPAGSAEFQGGDPTMQSLDVVLGDQTLKAQVMRSPALDGQPRHLSVVARHEAELQIGSCSLRAPGADDESQLLAWCAAGLAAALTGS